MRHPAFRVNNSSGLSPEDAVRRRTIIPHPTWQRAHCLSDEVAARRGAVEFGERLDISAGGERTVTAPGEHDRAHARLRRRRVEQAA